MRYLILLLFCLPTVPSFADLVLSIENVTVQSGSAGNLIGVFASSNTGETLNSFNLPIDFGNNGFGMPAGFAFPGSMLNNSDIVTGPTLGNQVTVTGTGALSSPPFTQNYEGVFNGAGESLLLTSTPTRLFDILFDTTAAAGTSIPVSIRLGNFLPQFQAITNNTIIRDEANNSGLLLVGGSISVTAVPEPSSMALLGLAASALAVRQGRKRRSRLAAS